MDINDLKIIDQMRTEMRAASGIFQPSPFWEDLCQSGVDLLSKNGFENFKRTVNMRYFNWGILGILAHQFAPVFFKWITAPKWGVFTAKVVDPEPHNIDLMPIQGFVNRFIYSVYLAMLFEYCTKIDNLKLLDSIDEPLLGNPIIVKYNSKYLSQDLCNSLIEFYSMRLLEQSKDKKIFHISEIGAGYGRLAWLILKVLPNITYTIIDIPPALFISQKYLTSIFGSDDVFSFTPFNNFSEIEESFLSKKIRFLSPHQIQNIPNKAFDLFINISSLHEMTKDQINLYFKEIDRLCTGHFYTKQWRKSRATSNGFQIKQSEYPIPSNWNTIIERRHPIQRWFFEALYKIK